MPGLTADAVDGLNGVDAACAVGEQTAIALKLFDGGGGERTQDAVDSTAVESKPAETGLQIGDIIAAQVGRGEEQQPIAETP